MFLRHGTGVHELNGQKSRYAGETVYFLAPEDTHDFFIEEETQFSVIKFLPGVLNGGVNASSNDYWDHLIKNLARKWTARTDRSCKPAQLLRAKGIIDIMVGAWLDEQQRVTEVHTHLLRSLLLLLDEGMQDVDEQPSQLYGANKITAMQNFIHANIRYPERLTVKNVSSEFGMSASSLKRFFTLQMGMALSDYVAALRLEMIKEKMRHSDATLTEIGGEFGFVDPSHFTTFIKKRTGVSPSSLRKQLTQTAFNQ